MDLSIFLAKVLGLYLVIISITLFVHKKVIKTIMTNVKTSPSLLFLTGILSLLFGLFLVNLHDTWEMDWRIILNVLGWLFLINGIFRILLPQISIKILNFFSKHNNAYYLCAVVTLLIGVYLTFYGFVM